MLATFRPLIPSLFIPEDPVGVHNPKVFLHWELEYPEVFFDRDGEKLAGSGFDAVVGNPPYIRIQELRGSNPTQSDYLLQEYESAQRNFDIYVNFTEKGYRLLSEDGILGYIESHKFFQNDFGEGIRRFISRHKSLRRVLSFGRHQVFEGASVYTCVLILEKAKRESFEYAEEDPNVLSNSENLKYHTLDANYTQEPWVFRSPDDLQVLEKINDSKQDLGQITSKIYQGVVTSADDIYLVSVKEKNGEKSLIENGKGETHEVESYLLQPFLKGQDVKRYAPLNPPQSILLPYRVSDGSEPDFIEEEDLRSNFPEAYDYFSTYEKELRKRDGGSMDSDRWYDLTRNQNMAEFGKEKIVTPEISYGGNFTYDSSRMFHKSKVYGLLFQDGWNDLEKSLLAILNSDLLWYYLKNTGYVLRGGYFTFKTDYLSSFGIPNKSDFNTKLNGQPIQERLPDEVETAIEARKARQSLNLNLLDYFVNYDDGPAIEDAGLWQPTSTNVLSETSEERSNSRVGTARVKRESPNTVLIEATARYKPGDEDAHETDQWGYTETDLLPAFRITDLTETEADLIEHFVPVAVDVASGFANFREMATKTNSLVDRLKAIELPDVDDVADDLENYLLTVERAEELDDKIEKTDDLIDEIVYELYDLTEEEIEIVEKAVGE
ncbi:Eco57I restriction-modification methylase domain-containing protein [Halorubrum sp. DM2]|uniref:Eco57I restriction-modification methylase domain-containing protein n=1 Tax=Halorubrum sp. DM2 TaxID=2527867 RepID=UPI0024B7D35A|nr:Eco57I restriction-modification methylase domain-containing protein [Halorubrum sp. DM2]